MENHPQQKIVIQTTEGVQLTPRELQQIHLILQSQQEIEQVQPKQQNQNSKKQLVLPMQRVIHQRNEKSSEDHIVQVHQRTPHPQKVYALQKVPAHQAEKMRVQPLIQGQKQKTQQVRIVQQANKSQPNVIHRPGHKKLSSVESTSSSTIQRLQMQNVHRQVQHISKQQTEQPLPVKLTITSLLSAVKRNEIAKIHASIRSYGLPRSGTKTTDYLCLQKALENKRTEIAKILINAGCRINSRSGDSERTPLGLAIVNNEVEIVRLLLLKGVKLDVGRSYSYRDSTISEDPCVLHFAVEQKVFNAIKELLHHPRINVNEVSSCGKTVIQELMENLYHDKLMSENERCKLIRLLLINGAKFDFISSDGSTALHCAAKIKYNDIFNSIIHHFGNVNITDQSGNTTLHNIILFSKIEDMVGAVVTLLAKGARVDLLNKFNETPLHIASKYMNFEILRIFIQYPCNFDHCDINGNTVLHNLLMDSIHLIDNLELIKIVENLLEKQVRIDIQNKRGETALHLAADNQQKKILQLLLPYVTDINISDNKERTLLHVVLNKIFKNDGVVNEDDLNIIQTLVTMGSRADAKDIHGVTPIHLALQLKNSVISNFLIQNIQDVNICDNDGKTFLHYLTESKCSNEAEELDKARTAQSLLERGANVDVKDSKQLCTPLYSAIINKQKEVIRILLAYNANVNICNANGKTPLHILITNPKINSTNVSEIAEMLISKGAKLNDIHKDGCTFLHIVARLQKLDLLKTFLVHFNEIDFQNHKGDTILHNLLEFNFKNEAQCVKIVSMLLLKKAKINISNHAGESPLHLAVRHQLGKVVKILIENDANVNLRDYQGNNVLHVLCSIIVTEENETIILEMLESIVSQGINVKAKNNSGQSPLVCALRSGSAKVIASLLKYGSGSEENVLHSATETKNKSIVEALLNFGVDVNAKNKDGKTALHTAVEKNREESLKVLLHYGADANIRDKKGKTPLHWACWYNRQELIRELLDYGGDVNATDVYGTTPLMLSQNHDQLSWNMVQYRIDRLRLAGVHIYKANDNCIANCKKPLDSGDYAEQCLQEIEKLKATKICDRPLLYEILLLNKSRFIEYNNNKTLLSYINNKQFKINFPLYGDLIKAAYCRIRVRNEILEPSKQALFKASKICLTNEGMEHILEYLENDDMRNLIEAAYLKLSKRKIHNFGESDEEPTVNIKRIRLDEENMPNKNKDVIYLAAN